jgi:predicted dehydrogenase
MSDLRDGQNWAPAMPPISPVVKPGEFVFAASHFDHGHIYGQISALSNYGGELKYVFDSNPARYEKVLAENPKARAVSDIREILDDPSIHAVTSAAIPSERCAIGLSVLESGKDYLTDKSPFTTLDQLASARSVVARTGRKYYCCYSERLLHEATYYAGVLINQGAIGRVLQVLLLAPHNLAASSRPAWFFEKEKYGGIITDIGSHQFEQFLAFSGATSGGIEYARAANLGNPEYPGLEDFGEALMTANTGASCYCRVDWFNPKGHRSWGDGRAFVMGDKGFLEIRKNNDLAREAGGNRIFLVDEEKEHEIDCAGKIGFPFFGDFILDVLNRTEKSMTQEHVFKVAELSMQAQAIADAKTAGSAGRKC